MMLSSKRILKPEMVSLDTENKVVIEIGQDFQDLTDLTESDTAEPDFKKKEKDAQSAAAKIIRHAEQQAEEIKSEALSKAAAERDEILQAANAEADEILAQAREEGYQHGMDSATAEGDKLKAEAQQILEAAKAERIQMQESLEPEIVDMITGITEKLLGDEIKVNPAVIMNLIKQGFAAATISGSVNVYVSADDYDTVNKNKDELLALTDGSVNLKITKDLSLSPMDCVIETPFGDIDCSLGHQFETLRANLTYILENK